MAEHRQLYSHGNRAHLLPHKHTNYRSSTIPLLIHDVCYQNKWQSFPPNNGYCLPSMHNKDEEKYRSRDVHVVYECLCVVSHHMPTTFSRKRNGWCYFNRAKPRLSMAICYSSERQICSFGLFLIFEKQKLIWMKFANSEWNRFCKKKIFAGIKSKMLE